MCHIRNEVPIPLNDDVNIIDSHKNPSMELLKDEKDFMKPVPLNCLVWLSMIIMHFKVIYYMK